MGILIQFPQPGTRTPPGKRQANHSAPQDERLAAAYRRDLDRAVALLLEHVQSNAYDGVSLILKPKARNQKPALVVGGFYRHRLTEAADAAMQLHLAIKLRAREQAAGTQALDARLQPEYPLDGSVRTMDSQMQQKWHEATLRYHRCEQMLRIAFSKQLRASPETTSILLSITQLHIETVANCLWEVVRQPGRATPQSKLETLNAIQLFRTVRAQVSTWMPPAGQEAAYFAANSGALSVDMMDEGIMLLSGVETALARIIGEDSSGPVSEEQRAGH
ncbi:hypothetical protein LMG19083_01074 [Ralstonia psammae]|uniref:Uncharacterized protein n=1 Tax=Ralstonia psammae TaxID=3058598 RepID=A0ABN9IKW9_9RALS|nr:hypothetical protein [Ralstonia sp. LMG 19083]CAJ0783698.1 hypothetical protein LMG19083_01074 [Ralstonia sp. LMG 19083]